VVLTGHPQHVTAQSGEPIKIGVILPLTGPSAAIGQEALKGIQFALEEAGNRIAGRPVQLVVADDQNSPNVGLTEARRLVENEVRFIQICHAGGGNGAWDAHGDMKSHAPLCRAVDKPVAGLISDLKQRGLLDSTLVVFGSEFGRSPWSQNTTGRDHNPKGYSVLLAGGGIKGGSIHGATDDVGYQAVEHRHYYSDLHATILNQLGLDYKKMEYEFVGRTFRLVEEGGGPIKEILA